VLGGGLLPRRIHLVRGNPGSGKTTLGFHFLTTAIKEDESALFISIGESEAQIRSDAASQGLDLSAVHFLDMSMSTEFPDDVERYNNATTPDDIQRETIIYTIIQQVKRLLPQRIFLDSMSQLRRLTPNAFQYRRQILAFLQSFVAQGSTIMITSESLDTAIDEDLQAICDSIINLNCTTDRQTLNIGKYRGSGFRRGDHSMRLSEKGLQVFPHLLPEMSIQAYKAETLSSGIPELDELLHGGLERGTVSILTGPSGVGKTSMGIQFMKEAAARGERSLVYLFDEAEEMLLHRCEAINIPVHTMMKQDKLLVTRIEPLHFTPDEFAYMVRKEVEREPTSLVMFDSISGYRLSMSGEDMVPHLHALCTYLQNSGLTVLLINDVESITGGFRATEIGISYMADNIIFWRYLETQGEIQRAVGVLKKRMTDFERTLRKWEITRYGIRVGSPLTNLRGILSGIPELLESHDR
ncbi:MAG TPA: ATPase domain-containing protein, partial [Ktedonobacteraceae bacterium]|nr:ATPase domain-containing protein [Ktedonobacteraceae bacterium]